MIMFKNWLLRVFGLANIVAEQAYQIDKLQMQCDLYEELALIEAEQIRKIVATGKLWESNDVY